MLLEVTVEEAAAVEAKVRAGERARGEGAWRGGRVPGMLRRGEHSCREGEGQRERERERERERGAGDQLPTGRPSSGEGSGTRSSSAALADSHGAALRSGTTAVARCEAGRAAEGSPHSAGCATSAREGFGPAARWLAAAAPPALAPAIAAAAASARSARPHLRVPTARRSSGGWPGRGVPSVDEEGRTALALVAARVPCRAESRTAACANSLSSQCRERGRARTSDPPPRRPPPTALLRLRTSHALAEPAVPRGTPLPRLWTRSSSATVAPTLGRLSTALIVLAQRHPASTRPRPPAASTPSSTDARARTWRHAHQKHKQRRVQRQKVA